MIKQLFVVAVVCLLLEALGTNRAVEAAQGGKITIQSSTSPIGRAITPRIQAWRDAVLKRDAATLVRFALPESRKSVAQALRDQRSPLSRTLFGIKGSYRVLVTDPSVRIMIFEHHLIGNSHNYATACFFKGEIRWPSSYIPLQEIAEGKAVKCLDWGFTQNEENQWFVSYGFAMPE